ncbi:MAG TPA: SRPBCC domain-containing protein [Acidimicrobiia bacterium]|nr:SRPBCC domain-containing protein [Acidimicrobiia bacterium]
MTVKNVEKDPEKLRFRITSEFDASIDRVWQLWSDPRQLERWWGPPTYPATVVRHEFMPGGTVSYYMTGPEGDQHHGWWKISVIDAPRRLEFEDGFADSDGEPNDEMPVTISRVELIEEPGPRVRMTIESEFPSLEAMEQMIAMGMEEGITAALGQIDTLLLETSPAS